jgi:putative endonuclease
MSNHRNGVLYVGFTDDITRRTLEHKNKKYDGFTKKFRIDRLVYFEEYLTIDQAMKREQQLKKWSRQWKIVLIEIQNPKWEDLFGKLPEHLTSIEVLDSLFRGNEKI